MRNLQDTSLPGPAPPLRWYRRGRPPPEEDVPLSRAAASGDGRFFSSRRLGAMPCLFFTSSLHAAATTSTTTTTTRLPAFTTTASTPFTSGLASPRLACGWPRLWTSGVFWFLLYLPSSPTSSPTSSFPLSSTRSARRNRPLSPSTARPYPALSSSLSLSLASPASPASLISGPAI
ncbi:hypothetical protein CDD80_5342 [Ophiocordyceps camponoti-rufipedis]|uniref:Uncharacterized protein n=1 Tax=Ophiocordyceps camponoti-rufipedis TaxID=2004952 RepID=A0A2C5YRH3_9HYPO|nr:hypothetical protein CDD80_5342 [Ophiocordyceps camponoti-rufipedis]